MNKAKTYYVYSLKDPGGAVELAREELAFRLEVAEIAGEDSPQMPRSPARISPGAGLVRAIRLSAATGFSGTPKRAVAPADPLPLRKLDTCI